MITGPVRRCPQCGASPLPTDAERFDVEAHVVTGHQSCACGWSFIYSRRCTPEEERLMAKTLRRGRRAPARPRKAKPAAKPAPRTMRAAPPRSQPLPGMEHVSIRALDDVALEYARIRDDRMQLTRDEVQLKQTALRLMKQYHKTIYRHDAITIAINPGEETLKVTIRKPTDAEPDAREETTAAAAAVPDDDDREDGGDEPEPEPEPEEDGDVVDAEVDDADGTL